MMQATILQSSHCSYWRRQMGQYMEGGVSCPHHRMVLSSARRNCVIRNDFRMERYGMYHSTMSSGKTRFQKVFHMFISMKSHLLPRRAISALQLSIVLFAIYTHASVLSCSLNCSDTRLA